MAEPTANELAETLDKLRDIHLPELSEAAILADWATAASLGLVAALLLTLLAGVFFRKPSSRRQELNAALVESRELAPAERLLAQARILQELAVQELRKRNSGEEETDWSATLGRLFRSDFFVSGPGTSLRDDLYRPNPGNDADALDRELVALLKRVRD